MKSKTSYFNKAIFKKNFSLYWPLWVSFLLIFMLGFPALLELNFFNLAMDMDNLDMSVNRVEFLVEVLNLPAFEIIIGIYAILYAMALFGYLFNSRSANMIHSLPVTRKELFFTNYFTGLLFMVVPEALTFIMATLVCISNEVTKVQYIGIWLIYMIIASILFYSMAIFCCFLTGQLLVVPLFYIFLNFFYPLFQLFAGLLMSHNGYGIDLYTVKDSLHLPMVCPFRDLGRDIRFYVTTERTLLNGNYVTNYTGIVFEGFKELLIYLAISFVFLGLAWIMYKKRSIECAQDLLAFDFLKPIFRWGIGLCMGYSCGLGIYLVLIAFDIIIGTFVQAIIVMFLSIIFFLVADMFVQKGFRIFTKRRMKECAAFTVFMVCCIGAVRFGTLEIEKKLPNKEEIVSASLMVNGWYLLDETDLDTILDFQKELLDHRNEFRYYDNLSAYEAGDNYVRFTYEYKNGRYMERSYNVPENALGEQVIDDFVSSLDKEQIFLNAFLGFRPDRVIAAEESYLECRDEHGYCNPVEISAENSMKLFKAVMKDVEAGNIQRYNPIGFFSSVYLNWEDEADLAYDEQIYLNLIISEREISGNMNGSLDSYLMDGVNNVAYSYYQQASITFGSQCSNIIQTLIEIGAIDSEDDLHIIRYDDYEEYEEYEEKVYYD